jgi:hypothetical protein
MDKTTHSQPEIDVQTDPETHIQCRAHSVCVINGEHDGKDSCQISNGFEVAYTTNCSLLMLAGLTFCFSFWDMMDAERYTQKYALALGNIRFSHSLKRFNGWG